MNPNDGLGKNRIEAFSDGVFAIAITLLVLDIHIPDGLRGPSLTHALTHLWPKLLSYALSFAIIGVYWVAHHIMLHAAERTNRTLLWLNNLCLLFVAFVPASAAMLGAYYEQPRMVVWYGVNLVLASGSFELLWIYITRHLAYPDVSPILVRLGHQRTLLALTIYAIAAALAFVNVHVSLAVYWLGPLVYIFVQTRVDDAQISRDSPPPAKH